MNTKFFEQSHNDVMVYEGSFNIKANDNTIIDNDTVTKKLKPDSPHFDVATALRDVMSNPANENDPHHGGEIRKQQLGPWACPTNNRRQQQQQTSRDEPVRSRRGYCMLG